MSAAATPPHRLLVEGWRRIHHSYALVAQAHCLSLARRGDIDLRFRDLPFHDERWRRTDGLFTAEDEALLAALPPPEPAFVPDVTLHMAPEFAPAPAGRKFTFATPEFRIVPKAWRRGIDAGADVDASVSVLTPSRWTATAFERYGIPAARVHVVPHGVDPRWFRTDAALRESSRRTLGFTGDDFVFMSAGAMTDNKGIGVLLDAFAEVAAARPETRLVLKGADGLYPSRQMLKALVDKLPAAARRQSANCITYLGDTLPMAGMAHLLRAADCYVSPYLAEGFNLPVLEAAACGVAVICTAGGATDDFTLPAFARPIRSTPVHVRMTPAEMGDALKPDRDDLVAQMIAAASDREATRAMGDAGARHVAERFTWDAVTERLVDALFGPPAMA